MKLNWDIIEKRVRERGRQRQKKLNYLVTPAALVNPRQATKTDRIGDSKMDNSKKDKTLLRLLLIGAILLLKLADQIVEARDKGDDIILSKGKIIMRGGKGKGE